MRLRVPHRAQSILDFIGNLYHSSHLHTIILFTWTDYKTIFFPIVSRVPLILSIAHIDFIHNTIDLICLNNSPGSLPVTLAASLLVDMAAFNSLRCRQSIFVQRRGRNKSTMEATPLWPCHCVAGTTTSLVNGHSMCSLVGDLWNRLGVGNPLPCSRHHTLQRSWTLKSSPREKYLQRRWLCCL